MHKSIALAVSLALAALIIAAPAAQAVTTVYTDAASFLTAVAPGSYLETFNTSFNDVTTRTFSGSGYGYTVTVSNPTRFVYSPGTFIGAGTNGDDLIITFTTGNVRAIGGNFFDTDFSDSFVASTINISLSDGTALAAAITSASDFRGFVSTAPITQMTLSGNGFNYVSMDNLRVGTIAATVPEAGTFAFLILGVTLAGIARLRRK